MIGVNPSNLKGYAAILMWSFSALFISWTPNIPTFLLVALCSLVGLSYFMTKWLQKPQLFHEALRQPWIIWWLFILAVPAYRGFYYAGLKSAPIIEANLINYLWPLLIVIFSRIISKTSLSRPVYIGSICCFIGIIFIGLSKSENGLFLAFEPGHVLALAAAIVWAWYSAATRRHPQASMHLIGVMHGLTAIGFFLLAWRFETIPPGDAFDIWSISAIIGLGLSVSLGYALWDNAMTHGDQHAVAVTAYFTPLLSTLWLFLFADSQVTSYVYIAAILILGGTMIARLPYKKLTVIAD